MYSFLNGAIAMGCGIIGLFFLRFWRQTRDGFFLIFSLAFNMLCLERIVPSVLELPDDVSRAGVYVLRLIAFLLIIGAIAYKNRSQAKPN